MVPSNYYLFNYCRLFAQSYKFSSIPIININNFKQIYLIYNGSLA